MLDDSHLNRYQLRCILLDVYNKMGLDVEVWAKIPGTVYAASTLGRVRNENTGYILKPYSNKYCKYLRMPLWVKNTLLLKLVHYWLALSFIEPDANKPEIDHINRNTVDNRLINLRRVTRLEQAGNKSITNASRS